MGNVAVKIQFRRLQIKKIYFILSFACVLKRFALFHSYVQSLSCATVCFSLMPLVLLPFDCAAARTVQLRWLLCNVRNRAPWRRRDTYKQTANSHWTQVWLQALSETSSSLGNWHLNVRGAKMRDVRPGSQSDARGRRRHAAISWSGLLRRPAGPLQRIRWEFTFHNRPIGV